MEVTKKERPESSVQVSVIIPTLNEVENIDSILASVLEQASASLDLDVLVADGGSTDGTIDRVRHWEGKGPVRLVVNGGKGGLAGDVLAAAEKTRSSVVVVMDADFSHPPSTIPELVAPVLAGQSDMVVGSRYVPGGCIPDWPMRRRILSRLGAMLAWPLADLKDPMSGFFAIRRDRLLAVDPNAAGFKIGLEAIAVGGDDLLVTEVPITFRDRTRGTSKIGILQMAAYVRRLLVLAGGAVSMGTASRFATVGLLGVGVDLSVFYALYKAGLSMVFAHVASFAVATVFNYILNARWSFLASAQAQQEPSWRRYLRFLTVCLLALFLRGGVLATAVNVWGWPPELAILLGIATAAAVTYFGSAFFIFPPLTLRTSRTVRWRIAALGILGYVIALRLIFMGAIELLPEEAYYWNYAQHLDFSYLDHPPMVAWLIWLGTTMFGQTEFAVRIGAALCWLVAAFFLFGFARNLFGKTSAFVSVLLFSVLPFFFAVGLMMTPDAPLTAAWAGALYFLERAMLGERQRAWWGVGLCMGFGMLSKYTIALLGPAAVLFVLLDPQSRRLLRSPLPYLAVLVATLLFSPVIAWNATHGWASFVFQGTRRLEAATDFSLPLLIGSILFLITPVGLAAAVSVLVPSTGLRRIWRGALDHRQVFITVFTLVPLSVFVAFSLFHRVKLNWTGPLWLAVLPAVAYMITTDRPLPLLRGLRASRAWGATITVVLLAYGTGFHYLALGLPGVGYDKNFRDFPVAWQEFASAAQGIEENVERATGQEPLLVGMDKYFLSSELAFYNRRDDNAVRNTAGRSLFGFSSLMYGYWFPSSRESGRTIIMFGLKPGDLAEGSVPTSFKKLGPVTEQTMYKGRSPVGRFYYRVGYGFRHIG